RRRPPRAPPLQAVPHGGFRAQPPYFKESVAHSNRARPEHVEASGVDGQEAQIDGGLAALAHTRARDQALAALADARRAGARARCRVRLEGDLPDGHAPAPVLLPHPAALALLRAGDGVPPPR